MLRHGMEALKQKFSLLVKGGQRKLYAAFLPKVMKQVVKAHQDQTNIFHPPMSQTIFVLNHELSKQIFSKPYDTALTRNKVFGVFSGIISPFMSFLQGNQLAHAEREIYKKHFKSERMKGSLYERSEAYITELSKQPLECVDLETHSITIINQLIGDILFGTKHIDIKTYKTLSEKLDEILSQTPVELEDPSSLSTLKKGFHDLNINFVKNYDDEPSLHTPFLKDIESWYKTLSNIHPELGQFNPSDLAPAGRITALGNIMKSFAFILYQLACNDTIKAKLNQAIDTQSIEVIKDYIERSMLYYMVTPAVARHLDSNISYGDTRLKKGSLILVPMRAIARLKLRQAFHAAKQSDPSLIDMTLEDWVFDLTRPLPKEIKLFRYPFTPFGLGHRKCPAASGFTSLCLMLLTTLHARCNLTQHKKDMETKHVVIQDNEMGNPIPMINLSLSSKGLDENLRKTLETILKTFFRTKAT